MEAWRSNFDLRSVAVGGRRRGSAPRCAGGATEEA